MTPWRDDSRTDDLDRGVDRDLGPHPTSQALIRLVPTLGPVVATWREDTYKRKQKRAKNLGAIASAEIGAEQFFEQLASDERLTDMFEAAVDQAIATSSEAKIRLLGKALAAGAAAADLAAVDTAEQLLRIALALEPVDIRALRALERWTGLDAEHVVGHALRVDEATAGPIVARLQSLHLIKMETIAQVNDPASKDDDQVHVEHEWRTTPTAQALMRLLHQRVSLDQPDAVRPDGTDWGGYTEAQAAALERLAALGRQGWRRAPRPDGDTAVALRRLSALGLDTTAVQEAMRSIGFTRSDLHELEKWQSL